MFHPERAIQVYGSVGHWSGRADLPASFWEDATNLFSKRSSMKRSLVVKAYGPKLPETLARIFGPPPLVGDEDPGLYKELFTLLAVEHDPQDTGDWLLVKDLVDLHWERLRERRLKPQVIKIYQEQPAEGSGQPLS